MGSPLPSLPSQIHIQGQDSTLLQDRRLNKISWHNIHLAPTFIECKYEVWMCASLAKATEVNYP